MNDIAAEMLASQLADCVVYFDGDDCAGGLIQRAAVAELKRLQAKDYEFQTKAMDSLTDAFLERRWIPASERLPAHDTRVLVAAKQRDGEVVVKEMLFVDWSLPPEPPAPAWSDDYGGEEFDSVTHWMPLPEPPEVK